MNKKYYRLYVNANFSNYKHKFAFSDTNKKRLFAQCCIFAQGFIKGFCVNSNAVISTNSVQKIDGFIWWSTVFNDVVLSIETENGTKILTEKDLNVLK